MRRALAPLVFLSLFALNACGRLGFDSLGNNDVPGVDGGGGSSDASPNAPDAPGSTGIMGPASMTVRTPWGGVTDHPVVFHDADGAVVAVEYTDADGTATHDIPADAMVTLIDPSIGALGGPSKLMLFTIMGVQPDDRLSHGSDIDPWELRGFAEVTLSGPVGGAAFYAVDVGCELNSTVDAGQPLVIALNNACFRGASNFDVIAYALDSAENILAYTTANDVAVVPGGTAQIGLPPWQFNSSDVVVTLSNPPMTASYADVTVQPVARGIPFYAEPRGDNVSLTGPTEITTQIPSGFAGGLQYMISLYHKTSMLGASPPPAVSYLIERRATAVPTVAHDMSTDFLAPIVTVWLDDNIADRPALDLVGTGDYTSADGGLAVVAWVDGGGNFIEWWLLFPPGLDTVKVPELPDLLAGFRPTATSEYNSPQVVILDADFINGFADMRTNHGFDVISDPHWLPRTDSFVLRAVAGPGGFFK